LKRTLFTETGRRPAKTTTLGIVIIVATVAVIVQAVAQFWHGPLGPYAQKSTVLTNPNALAALTNRRTAGPSAAGIPVVHTTVTIIIKAVAHLRHGAGEAFADQGAVDTGRSPRCTFPDVGLTGSAATRVSVVEAAITIVIQTVALLSDGLHLPLAQDCTFDAAGDALHTQSLVGAAWLPTAGVTIVVLAITVIIETVAFLRHGTDGADAFHLAGHAVSLAGHTGAG
jgi:hypothetical protein